ncbi:MAG: AMP-binding protein, partial [Burkholderiaceae bacterium]|nr:AMP-binding protein [Burkholderiaceae bacterium]
MNIAQLLVRTARTYPDNPAVLLGATPVLDYGQLGMRAARLAGYLQRSLGLQAGDRVALYMTNHVAYLEILYAAWWAGLVVVPINAKLHVKELEFIVNDSAAGALFVTEDLVPNAAPLLQAMPSLRKILAPDQIDNDAALQADPIPAAYRLPHDLAWLFYTSGTTGRPKGVMQTHGNLYAMTSCYFSDVDCVDAQDAIVYAAPMSHGAGMYNFMFVAKAARHVVPASGGFDSAELVELSRQVGRLSMFAAPTMVKRLVEHIDASGAQVDGFKTIVYGGGPMYAEDIQAALRTMGSRFVQIYGQGESPMTITALSREQLAHHEHPEWSSRIASVGVAQMLVEVRVVDEA